MLAKLNDYSQVFFWTLLLLAIETLFSIALNLKFEIYVFLHWTKLSNFNFLKFSCAYLVLYFNSIQAFISATSLIIWDHHMNVFKMEGFRFLNRNFKWINTIFNIDLTVNNVLAIFKPDFTLILRDCFIDNIESLEHVGLLICRAS